MAKAKILYKQMYDECACCGSTRFLQVHHVRPLHLFPRQYKDFKNFVTLCNPLNNGCHRWVAHFGDYINKYNENIKELIIHIRHYYSLHKLPISFQIPLVTMDDFYNRIPSERL